MHVPPSLRLCDVFCRVIDNFGDAAVAWRLASQLALEWSLEVRLWIDKPEVLHALVPEAAVGCPSGLICIRHWADATAPADSARAQPPDLVVEMFGCGLGDDYVAQIAGRGIVWIVLEYLSAESWVASRHGLPSPHPRHPAQRYFFFPGFVPGTGGLLREQALDARRLAFLDPQSTGLWWRLWGGAPEADTLTLSLFGYENMGLHQLLDHWAAADRPVLAVIPESKLRTVAGNWVAGRQLVPHHSGGVYRYRAGRLEIRFLPFLSQAEYDHLLWACHCNFVRGEDSFVRAQWAARPLIWNIYPQENGVHRTKLEAFLGLYARGLPTPVAKAVQRLWQAWDDPRPGVLGGLWDDYHAQLKTLEKHAIEWACAQRAQGSLAERLVQFWHDKVQ